MLYLGLFFVSVLLGVGSALIQGRANQDKARSAEAIDQDSIPKATVGDPIGIVFGTVPVDGANTITSGNNRYVEQIVSSGSGKKK